MPPLTEELPTADFYTHNYACGVNTRMVRVTATLHRHVIATPYSAPHEHKVFTPSKNDVVHTAQESSPSQA